MDTSSEKEKALALLQKYKAGLCTPVEAARIKKWFDSFDDLSTELDDKDMQRAADEAAYKTLNRLFNERDAAQNGQRKLRPLYTALLRIAACLVIGGSVYFIAGHFRESQPPAITYTSYSTKKGERREIQLQDGSIVTLNAASTIQVASDFDIKNRKVVLQGEAFFLVSKDKTRPFIIKTGKIQTRVVGTSFDINAYPEENSITVAVSTGKVQVEKEEAAGEKLIGKDLTHNNLLIYNLKTDTYRHILADADLLNAWRTNKLVFNQASISHIADVIERTYDVRVVLKGKPHKVNLYTVTFDNYPLDKLLPLLAELSGVTYKLKTDQLILNTQNCR